MHCCNVVSLYVYAERVHAYVLKGENQNAAYHVIFTGVFFMALHVSH